MVLKLYWKDLEGEAYVLGELHKEEELYYFLGYTINYHDNHLTLRISNKKTLRDYTKTINQYLKDVKNHNTVITNNNNVLNQVKQNRLNMGDKETR